MNRIRTNLHILIIFTKTQYKNENKTITLHANYEN